MKNSTLKVNALAKELEVLATDIIETSDNTFEIDGYEYLVLNEEEREEEVTENIKENLWAFNTSFLADQTELDEVIFIALADKYDENGNEAVLKLIEITCGIEEFVNESVNADGYGHFLAHYDGEELELENNLYAYRTN